MIEQAIDKGHTRIPFQKVFSVIGILQNRGVSAVVCGEVVFCCEYFLNLINRKEEVRKCTGAEPRKRMSFQTPEMLYTRVTKRLFRY